GPARHADDGHHGEHHDPDKPHGDHGDHGNHGNHHGQGHDGNSDNEDDENDGGQSDGNPGSDAQQIEDPVATAFIRYTDGQLYEWNRHGLGHFTSVDHDVSAMSASQMHDDRVFFVRE